MNKTEQGEMVSALADGEVRGDALAQVLRSIEVDPELQRTWETYHLVGDVLRSPDLAAGLSSSALLARLRPALTQAGIDPVPTAALPVAPVSGRRVSAANDARWKVVAGLASVAAVVAVGWNVAGLGSSPGQAQLAAVPAQATPVLAGGGVMLRDARLDELMAAHRQFGSATAIPMPAGALRNATFEAPAR